MCGYICTCKTENIYHFTTKNSNCKKIKEFLCSTKTQLVFFLFADAIRTVKNK